MTLLYELLRGDTRAMDAIGAAVKPTLRLSNNVWELPFITFVLFLLNNLPDKPLILGMCFHNLKVAKTFG